MTTHTPEEEATLQTYGTLAHAWSSAGYHDGLWDEDLRILRELAPSGPVLEVGAGDGNYADQLAASYGEYAGIDASAEMVATARRLHPLRSFEVLSVYDLAERFSPGTFQVFWMAAVLLHIPKARCGEALAALKAVVSPGGYGFISVKLGAGQQLYSLVKTKLV